MASTNDNNTRNIRVLYVEDNGSNRQIVAQLLDRKDEFQITLSETAENAIKMLKEHNQDLILLDLDLPGMNGYEFFEWLQGKEEFREIPVIVLTAKAMTVDLEIAKNYNFSDYLVKPFLFDELFQSIESAVNVCDR